MDNYNSNQENGYQQGNYQSTDVQNAVNDALKAKKKKKRKTWLIIIGAAILVIIIASIASGGSNDSQSAGTNGGTPSSTQNVAAEENENSNDGKIGDYVCKVKSAKKCKNYLGEDSVLITYEFTNNSSSPASFDVALDDNVYQAGVALEETISQDDNADEYIDVQIKPGITKDVSKIYKLRDSKTDLEVEIGEWLSFDDTKITTTVTLK